MQTPQSRVIQHFLDYLEKYRLMNVTPDRAAFNYTREFPARIPQLLLALLEKKDG